MATPEPVRRRQWGGDDFLPPLHPVDRSVTSKPLVLPRHNTKYGSSRFEPPARGVALLRLEIEREGHVPSTEDLRKQLRYVTEASSDSPLADGGADTTSTSSVAAKCRSIRDAVDAIAVQCPSIRPLLTSVCDAYEAEIRRAAAAQSHPQLPSKAALRETLVDVMIANEAGDSPLLATTTSKTNLTVPTQPGSQTASRAASGVYASGVFAGSPSISEYGSAVGSLSKRQLAAQLHDAQAFAVAVGERVEALERENAALHDAGSEMRQAVDEASRKLQAAVAGFQRSHMLDGVTIEELDSANAPLHEVDGVTLLLLSKAWKRREDALVQQVSLLTAALAEKEVMLHRLSALAAAGGSGSAAKTPVVFSPTRSR